MTHTEIVIFKSDIHYFGIEFHHIVEIAKIVNFEPIHSSEKYAHGYFDYRQLTLPVVDVCLYFNHPHGFFSIEHLIAIVSDSNDRKFGLLLDEIVDILYLDKNHNSDSSKIDLDNCIHQFEFQDKQIPLLNMSFLYQELIHKFLFWH